MRYQDAYEIDRLTFQQVFVIVPSPLCLLLLQLVILDYVQWAFMQNSTTKYSCFFK